jgi:hypothetical protein
MKSLIPVLLFLIVSCSGTPKNKTVQQIRVAQKDSSSVKPVELKTTDYSEFKPVELKKPNESDLAEIPFDSALVPEEELQNYFRFVRHNNFIVLGLFADTNLATGNPRMVDMSFSPVAVTKAIDMNKVSDSLKLFVGKKFHMIGKNGEQYDSKIISLKILIDFFPAYGETESETESSHSDSLTIARNSWNEGNEGKAMIVGETDVLPDEEVNIVGAVPAEMPVPLFFESETKSKLQTQIENDSKTTKQYSIIQENYIKSNSGSGDWTEQADEQFFSCSSTPEKRYCSLTESFGTFCGNEFYADLTSVWETNAGKKNKLLFSFPGYCTTTLIFDIEGDGTPEILVEDFGNSPVLFKKVNGKWKAVSYCTFTDWRCPC